MGLLLCFWTEVRWGVNLDRDCKLVLLYLRPYYSYRTARIFTKKCTHFNTHLA